MVRLTVFFTVILLLSCQQRALLDNHTEEQAKNIIFLIGDGMGVSHITASIYSNKNTSSFEQFKHIGFHKQQPINRLITDSAAGATAFSIGKKTFNGAIGVDMDTLTQKTILEEAEEKALATGLIATSTITHATPASFIAHQESRNSYEKIAEDFLQTEIDLFIGGGLNHFSKRKDKRNLLEDLKSRNYLVSDSSQISIEDLEFNLQKNIAYFTSEGSPVSFLEGRNYLLPATKKGITYLDKKNDKGFFLMIESSQIDWAGHDNDQEYLLGEMTEFEEVVAYALQFARQNKETLLIVTADHETGGLSITGGTYPDSLECRFNSGGHTADILPVFAYGPGAQLFQGIYENKDIYHKMRLAFGWK